MARNNYYSNNYSPHMFFDGSIDGGYNTGSWQARIENERENESALTMTLGGTYNPDSLSGHLDVAIFTELNPGVTNIKCRVALIENRINRTSPNGTRVHNQVLRDMIPNSAGTAVTLTEGDTTRISVNFRVPSPIVDDNCELVVWVQTDQTRNILQAAKVGVLALGQDAIDEDAPVPGDFSLAQNYPNPFNAQTEINFTTMGGNTRLEVFDITGAKVATVLNSSLNAGTYSVIWDGKNSIGQAVSSGTYLYRLTSDDGIQTKRMTLVK
jgi:hypothetical protein